MSLRSCISWRSHNNQPVVRWTHLKTQPYCTAYRRRGHFLMGNQWNLFSFHKLFPRRKHFYLLPIWTSLNFQPFCAPCFFSTLTGVHKHSSTLLHLSRNMKHLTSWTTLHRQTGIHLLWCHSLTENLFVNVFRFGLSIADLYSPSSKC